MTTLFGSKKDLTVSIGFFVLVAGAIAASTLARGSTAVGVTFLAVAVGLVVLAVVLHRRPANELRVSPDEIELRRPSRTIGSLERTATGGRIEVRRHVYRGRAFWSLVPAGADPTAGISVDDFVPDEIRAAAELHGWDIAVVD
jgi:hypothetical protein